MTPLSILRENFLARATETWAHIALALLELAATLLLGWIIKQFLATYGRKWAEKTKNELDDRIIAAILPRIKWLALVLGLFFASEEIANITTKNPTAAKVLGYTNNAIYAAFVFVLTMAAIRLIDTIIGFTMNRYSGRTGVAADEALFLLVNRFIAVFIGAIAVVMVLGHFGVDVSSFLVFLGGGSVALALAAQETLSNMIAGFVIMIDRPFRIGDRVKLPTGEIGDVFEIGMRSTKILDFDHNLIISPNSELVKTRVVNYSYPEARIRVAVDVGVAYGTDLRVARETILALMRAEKSVLKEPAPQVVVVALADSSVNLQAVAFTADFHDKSAIETSLREHIYQEFSKAGIEIPFPQRVVTITPSSGKLPSA